MFRKFAVFLLAAFLLLALTACKEETMSTTGDYAFLNGTPLPKGISMVEAPEGGYMLILDNAQIGGINMLDLTKALEEDPYLYNKSDHLIEAAEDIIQQFSPSTYDYIASYGDPEYMKVNFVKPDGTNYTHYIFEVDAGYCDLWYDQAKLSKEARSQFATLYLPDG